MNFVTNVAKPLTFINNWFLLIITFLLYNQIVNKINSCYFNSYCMSYQAYYMSHMICWELSVITVSILTLQTILSLIFRHHCASLIRILSLKYKYRRLYELLTRLDQSLILMRTDWLFNYDVLGHYNTFRLLNCLFDGKIGPRN